MSEPLIPLYVRLAADQARKLEQAVATSGKSKRQFVEDAVREYVGGENPLVGRVAFRDEPRDILTAEEVGALLSLEPEQVNAAAEAGELPGRKLAGQWRFSRKVVMNWIEGAEAADGGGSSTVY
ncbi:MAG: helix-turn-helix domain-containing protein [Actinomycetota bacterium]|nr:helix-turn-helix domain-containing protein [Actinomycetota bacterium]